MRNDSHLSEAGYGKFFAAILLCLVFLVILKPDRLRGALNDLDNEAVAEEVAAPWEQMAGLLRLSVLSEKQHDFFAFYSPHVVIGGTEEVDRGAAGVIFATGPEESATSAKLQGAKKMLTVHNASGVAGNATFAGKQNATVAYNATLASQPAKERQTNGTSAVPNAISATTLHPVYVDVLSADEWYFPAPPLEVLMQTRGAGIAYSDWGAIPYTALLPALPPIIKSRILLTGDSMMMEGLGPALLRQLKQRRDLEVRREAVYSTGLCRRDYFDWPAHMTNLVNEYIPDLVVICIGGNDAQDIVDENKKRHLVGTESWQAEYRTRAEELATAAQAKGARLIWVGLPILGKEPQAKNTRLLTAQQQAVCEEGARRTFVDTYRTLADSTGAYTTFMKDESGKHIRMRSKDQVHVSEAGGRLLAKVVVPVIERFFPIPEQALLPGALPVTKENASVASGQEPISQPAGTSRPPAANATKKSSPSYPPLGENGTEPLQPSRKGLSGQNATLELGLTKQKTGKQKAADNLLTNQPSSNASSKGTPAPAKRSAKK